MDTMNKPEVKQAEDPSTKRIRVLEKQVERFKGKFQEADREANFYKDQVKALEKKVRNQKFALRGQSRKLNDIVLGVMASDAIRKGTFSDTAAKLKES